jgi:hypothetical protein
MKHFVVFFLLLLIIGSCAKKIYTKFPLSNYFITEKRAFDIQFGGDYKNDTVTLTLNNRKIVHDKIFRNEGWEAYVPNTEIIYECDTLRATIQSETFLITDFVFNKKLNIIYSVGKQKMDTTLSIKRGRFIDINFDRIRVDPVHVGRKIKIHQTQKPVPTM